MTDRFAVVSRDNQLHSRGYAVVDTEIVNGSQLVLTTDSLAEAIWARDMQNAVVRKLLSSDSH